MGVDGDDAKMACLCPSHDHLPQMTSYPTVQGPLTQTGQCTVGWSQSGIASREMPFERGEGPNSYPRVRFFVRQCESRTFLPTSIAPKLTIPDLPRKFKRNILPPSGLPNKNTFSISFLILQSNRRSKRMVGGQQQAVSPQTISRCDTIPI